MNYLHEFEQVAVMLDGQCYKEPKKPQLIQGKIQK